MIPLALLLLQVNEPEWHSAISNGLHREFEATARDDFAKVPEMDYFTTKLQENTKISLLS